MNRSWKTIVGMRGAKYLRYTEYTYDYFLSATAIPQVIFWSENNFHLISDWRNSFNLKLKKLIKKQLVILYSPTNTLRLSDKSVQIKILSIFSNVLFSLGSIYKYWVFLNKVISSLKQIDQMCKCALS